jgi:AcrR family transcriptional regulator
MPRNIPADRFDGVVRAATRVFLRQGYRRTQMADVAAELGVAKGTLYLYVESKEALFEQVLLHADRTDALPLPAVLPLPTPRPGSTLRMVRERLLEATRLPVLGPAASGRRRTQSVHDEVAAIARELMQVLGRHKVGIKLLDRCAPDFPELAGLYYSEGRAGLVGLLEAYLERRIAQRALPPVADTALSARMVIETAAYWAVHRHWDADPKTLDGELVEEAAVEFITRALLGGKKGVGP